MFFKVVAWLVFMAAHLACAAGTVLLPLVAAFELYKGNPLLAVTLLGKMLACMIAAAITALAVGWVLEDDGGTRGVVLAEADDAEWSVPPSVTKSPEPEGPGLMHSHSLNRLRR